MRGNFAIGHGKLTRIEIKGKQNNQKNPREKKNSCMN
jgi:hypothetical protein